MYLRMRRATPSVYLDLACCAQNDCQEDCRCKRAIPQVILNNKKLQPITTMYFQWTVNKTGK